MSLLIVQLENVTNSLWHEVMCCAVSFFFPSDWRYNYTLEKTSDPDCYSTFIMGASREAKPIKIAPEIPQEQSENLVYHHKLKFNCEIIKFCIFHIHFNFYEMNIKENIGKLCFRQNTFGGMNAGEKLWVLEVPFYELIVESAFMMLHGLIARYGSNFCTVNHLSSVIYTFMRQ